MAADGRRGRAEYHTGLFWTAPVVDYDLEALLAPSTPAAKAAPAKDATAAEPAKAAADAGATK